MKVYKAFITYIVTIPIDPNDYSFKDKMVAKRTYPTLEHF